MKILSKEEVRVNLGYYLRDEVRVELQCALAEKGRIELIIRLVSVVKAVAKEFPFEPLERGLFSETFTFAELVSILREKLPPHGSEGVDAIVELALNRAFSSLTLNVLPLPNDKYLVRARPVVQERYKNLIRIQSEVQLSGEEYRALFKESK